MPTWTELERRFRLEGALRQRGLDPGDRHAGRRLVACCIVRSGRQITVRVVSDDSGAKACPNVRPRVSSRRSCVMPRAISGCGIEQSLGTFALIPLASSPIRKTTRGSASGGLRRDRSTILPRCLRLIAWSLAAMTSEEENIARLWTVHVSGPNARFNLDTIDNSSNVIAL